MRVEVRGLSKSFGQVQAVSDLGFTVEPGTVTGFLGPNGAGKTTTLRMVLGLDAPRRRDGDLQRRARTPSLTDPLRTVGAVLETAFHPARSGRNHLRVYCRAAGLPALPGRRGPGAGRAWPTPAAAAPAATRSGMRQRLALATALLGDPAVLVLDEPANGLDPEGIQWLRGFLRHLAHDQGRTVLVSSHLLSEVEQTVDRVVIVGAGRLVREGSMEQLRSRRRRRRHGPRPQPRGRRGWPRCCAPTAPLSPQEDGALTVTGSTPADVGRRAFAAGIELHELRVPHQRPRGDLLPAHRRPGAVRRARPRHHVAQEAAR